MCISRMHPTSNCTYFSESTPVFGTDSYICGSPLAFFGVTVGDCDYSDPLDLVACCLYEMLWLLLR